MRNLLLCAVLLLLFACDKEEDPKFYTTFELASPQLGLTKKIWLYLPAGYDKSGDQYPVIYMQDGQWLFQEDVGYSQEMHVDETLRELESNGFEGAIVVGIESDETTRADEFSLYENVRLSGGGKGADYLAFLVETLKPYVDSHYRTKVDRGNTCIMGASLGGLAAVFALTEYPEVFGKAALFSAALHYNADSVFSKARHHEISPDVRLYGVVGKNEFNEQVDFPLDNQSLFGILGRYMPAEQLHFEIIEDGEHKIWFWEREFPKAIEFLFD
jgi:predicted alpha/beta superfamily hydrolase